MIAAAERVAHLLGQRVRVLACARRGRRASRGSSRGRGSTTRSRSRFCSTFCTPPTRELLRHQLLDDLRVRLAPPRRAAPAPPGGRAARAAWRRITSVRCVTIDRRGVDHGVAGELRPLARRCARSTARPGRRPARCVGDAAEAGIGAARVDREMRGRMRISPRATSIALAAGSRTRPGLSCRLSRMWTGGTTKPIS